MGGRLQVLPCIVFLGLREVAVAMSDPHVHVLAGITCATLVLYIIAVRRRTALGVMRTGGAP